MFIKATLIIIGKDYIIYQQAAWFWFIFSESVGGKTFFTGALIKAIREEFAACYCV